MMKFLPLLGFAFKAEDKVNDVDDEDVGDGHPLNEGHPSKSKPCNEEPSKGWTNKAAKEEQGCPKS